MPDQGPPSRRRAKRVLSELEAHSEAIAFQAGLSEVNPIFTLLFNASIRAQTIDHADTCPVILAPRVARM